MAEDQTSLLKFDRFGNMNCIFINNPVSPIAAVHLKTWLVLWLRCVQLAWVIVRPLFCLIGLFTKPVSHHIQRRITRYLVDTPIIRHVSDHRALRCLSVCLRTINDQITKPSLFAVSNKKCSKERKIRPLNVILSRKRRAEQSVMYGLILCRCTYIQSQAVGSFIFAMFLSKNAKIVLNKEPLFVIVVCDSNPPAFSATSDWIGFQSDTAKHQLLQKRNWDSKNIQKNKSSTR